LEKLVELLVISGSSKTGFLVGPYKTKTFVLRAAGLLEGCQAGGRKAKGLKAGMLECWNAGMLECWKASKLEGWAAGRLDGWTAGRLDGWKAGRLAGWKGGWLEGWKAGEIEGLGAGLLEGCGCEARASQPHSF
jgi:hypothetical protein